MQGKTNLMKTFFYLPTHGTCFVNAEKGRRLLLPWHTVPDCVTSASFRTTAHIDLSSAFVIHLLTPIDWAHFSIQYNLLNFGLSAFLLPSGFSTNTLFKFWYFADRASQYIYLNINQLDALNFIMSLFHASTCYEHLFSKHVEAWNKLIIKFSSSSCLILK